MNRISAGLFKSFKICIGSEIRWLSHSPVIYLEQKSEHYATDFPEEAAVTSFRVRRGESIQRLKARLLYQSRKRGMLENGILLSTFAAKYLPAMDENQLKLYDRLINSANSDWDLYYWATGLTETPKEYEHEVMRMLKDHVKSTEKKKELGQPNLY